MRFLDLHFPAKADKFAHDVEFSTRCMGDQGHNRRLSTDIVEVEADLIGIPHYIWYAYRV